MTQNSVDTTSRLLQFLSTSTSAAITCSTVMPFDDTIPQSTEGTQILTLAITPTSASSVLVINYSSSCRINPSAANYCAALFQDSTANALAAVAGRSTRDCSLQYVMTSGTTSSTTFKIRIGPDSSSTYVNADSAGNRLMGGVASALLTIEEYL